jgi:hypothetical protein
MFGSFYTSKLMVAISPALEISDHYAKHARTSGRSYNCDYMVDAQDQVTITFFLLLH